MSKLIEAINSVTIDDYDEMFTIELLEHEINKRLPEEYRKYLENDPTELFGSNIFQVMDRNRVIPRSYNVSLKKMYGLIDLIYMIRRNEFNLINRDILIIGEFKEGYFVGLNLSTGVIYLLVDIMVNKDSKKYWREIPIADDLNKFKKII